MRQTIVGTTKAMRLTKEELSARVVVRRSTIGSTPFRWEVHWGDRLEPVFVSPTKFANMEAAYQDGQARLLECMRSSARRFVLDEGEMDAAD